MMVGGNELVTNYNQLKRRATNEKSSFKDVTFLFFEYLIVEKYNFSKK